MLFLPPQTTKYCAHYWYNSQNNLATCYSKQVLRALTAMVLKNHIGIFLLITHKKLAPTVELFFFFLDDLLQCTSIYRCALYLRAKKKN